MDEETKKGEEESSSSDSSDDAALTKGKGGTPTPKKTEDADGSSVTTRQNKTERQYSTLRMAIDEKFIPRSIKNLKMAAYIIFAILLLLAIVFYTIQTQLFDGINNNIKNIHYSEHRLNYIIDINLRIRTLIMVNNGYLEVTPQEKPFLIASTIEQLRSSASLLKKA